MNIVGIISVVLFALLPELLAIGCLVGSGLVAWKAKSIVHYCAMLAEFAVVLWSLIVLYQIYFLRAFQISCSPLILDGVAVGIFVVQFIWLDKRHEDVA
jgi:hypothetical protein